MWTQKGHTDALPREPARGRYRRGARPCGPTSKVSTSSTIENQRSPSLTAGAPKGGATYFVVFLAAGAFLVVVRFVVVLFVVVDPLEEAVAFLVVVFFAVVFFSGA